MLLTAKVSPALKLPVTSLTLNSVSPAPFNPVDPLVAKKPLLAKYVKEFNHSTLTPLVHVNASTPGVINVAAWNKQLASFESACATLPSKKAPLPASP